MIGYFPKTWKFSVMKLIAKIKDPVESTDPGPMTFINVISNTFENFVKPPIYEYVTNDNTISRISRVIQRITTQHLLFYLLSMTCLPP